MRDSLVEYEGSEIHSVSKYIKDKAEDFKTECNNINKAVDNSIEYYDSEDHDTFVKKFGELSKLMNATYDGLLEISKTLNNQITNYEDNSSNLKGSAGKLPS